MRPSEGEQGQAAAVASIGAGRRRRLPSPAEQARRVAWGKQWGAILKAHAQTYKRKA